MMDIEKLIHCLQCCSRVDAHNTGCEDCDLEYCGTECQELCGTAAIALSTLKSENAELRNELRELKIKWDMYGGDDGVTAVYTELEQLLEMNGEPARGDDGAGGIWGLWKL